MGTTHNRWQTAVLTILLLALTGCPSIRPVVKIGLIAPFEGLYRDTGYTALAALRQGIADCAGPGQDVIPLALDDSADPGLARRAAQKLLADPGVAAVIGPFPLAAVPAVGEVLAASNRLWIVPAAVAPAGGYADPAATDWVAGLAQAVIAAESPGRVWIAGLPDGMAAALPSDLDGTPLIRTADGTAFTRLPGDAMLWLAAPDAGAAWASAYPETPFWLGAPYGGDIWAQRAGAGLAAHWLIWRDPAYNTGPQPSTPAPPADATYRATCAILAQLGSERAATATSWQLITRRLHATR